jgi:hypothetical protein
MEVHHDFDLVSDRFAKSLHDFVNAIHIRQWSMVMRVGNEDRLQGLVTSTNDLKRTLDDGSDCVRLVDGAHISKTKVGVYLDAIAHLSTEKAPHRLIEKLTQNVPKSDLDSGDGRHADDPQPPEAMLLHRPNELFDIAGIAPDQQRLQVSDCARNCSGLPFARRFAPAVQSVGVRVDADKYPVPHFRVDNSCGDSRYAHWVMDSVSLHAATSYDGRE